MKQFFLGSNTPEGFLGAFERLTSAKRLIILKGGAGTGKSTLMKKAAATAEGAGYSVELYRCSSDVDSLDAVYVPALGRGIIDGTAPHVVEAEKPALCQFVINLLEKADFKKLTAASGAVDKYLYYKKQYFIGAYANLKCADALERRIFSLCAEKLSPDGINKTADEIYSLISTGGSGESGRLFAKAITNKGVVNFYSEDFPEDTLIAIRSDCAAAIARVLDRVKLRLSADGTAFTELLNPLQIEYPDALKIGKYLIADRKLLPRSDYMFELDPTPDSLTASVVRAEQSVIDLARSRAVENLILARNAHLEIEKIYTAAMDWESINSKTTVAIDLLLN